MNPVKSWFLSRILREKMLVLVLVLTAAVIWLSSATDHLKAKLSAYRAAVSTLATQQVWLDAKPEIEKAAEEAVKNLDPSKTYNSTFLVSKILGLAGESGLTVNTDPPRTLRSSQFSVHTVQVITRRAELPALLRFYQKLASEAPYLGLEYVQITGDRSNPGMINATLQVASVELVRDGASKAPAK